MVTYGDARRCVAVTQTEFVPIAAWDIIIRLGHPPSLLRSKQYGPSERRSGARPSRRTPGPRLECRWGRTGSRAALARCHQNLLVQKRFAGRKPVKLVPHPQMKFAYPKCRLHPPPPLSSLSPPAVPFSLPWRTEMGARERSARTGQVCHS